MPSLGVAQSCAADCLLLLIDRLLLLFDCLLLMIDCLLLFSDVLLRLFPSRIPVDEAISVHFAWYQNTDKRDKEILLVTTTPKA